MEAGNPENKREKEKIQYLYDWHHCVLAIVLGVVQN